MNYIWQTDDWPKFFWDEGLLLPLLTRVSYKQGKLLGKMEGLGFDALKDEAHLTSMTDNVVKSGEIEGEDLPHDEVRSSIARQLGMNHINNLVPSSKNVDGFVELMTDATGAFSMPLTKARLFKWHELLFSAGLKNVVGNRIGAYRRGPMQVVSGVIGKEKVHYEAPQPNRLNKNMSAFLRWFENPGEINPLLAAGLADRKSVV